jgi:hypothetical protein
MVVGWLGLFDHAAGSKWEVSRGVFPARAAYSQVMSPFRLIILQPLVSAWFVCRHAMFLFQRVCSSAPHTTPATCAACSRRAPDRAQSRPARPLRALAPPRVRGRLFATTPRAFRSLRLMLPLRSPLLPLLLLLLPGPMLLVAGQHRTRWQPPALAPIPNAAPPPERRTAPPSERRLLRASSTPSNQGLAHGIPSSEATAPLPKPPRPASCRLPRWRSASTTKS